MNRLHRQFDSFLPVFRRELGAYFATPMAYVFLAVFLLSLGMFTWEAARFFDTGTADLSPFFVWHPWIYMIFLPALAMRLWADETSAGTDELLLSLPLGMPGMVLGKLCAAWMVAAAVDWAATIRDGKLGKHTVPALKAQLKRLNLSTAGKRANLVARLEDHYL